MQGGQGAPSFPNQAQGTGQPRPQSVTPQTMVPTQAAPQVAQAPAAPAQVNAYQYQQQKGQAPHHQLHQQYLQAQSHIQQQGQYRQQQQPLANTAPGLAQPVMQTGMQQGMRPQQGTRPAGPQYNVQQQQQMQQQQQQLQQQQNAQAAQRQAQPRPTQGAPGPQPLDAQAVARMLQNMPTVEYIARTLNMEQPNVESLLQSGSPQGRSYLAQQLTQRGAIPGGGLGQTAAQQPAGVQNQQVKRPTPPPGVNRAAPPALARRTNMPFQAGPAGQQAQGPAGMSMGVQPAGVMGAHRPRPAQARPYYPPTGSYAQQPGSYSNTRPAFPHNYGQHTQRPGTPTGTPMGNVSMNPQTNTFIVQQRPQLGQAGLQPPPRQATPQPPLLSEDDRKFLNKPALQQLLTKIGGSKLHLKPEVETALTELIEDLIGQALSFGCSMARRRQSAGAAAEDLVLQPADVAAFLEHSWQLHVPGFGGDALRPYKRPAASELHKTRAAAVRRAQATTAAGPNAEAEGS